MAIPVNLFLRSSCCLQISMLATMESVLMMDCLFEALGLFLGCTVRLHSRLKGGGPLDVPGQWQCAICGALMCWPTRNQCYKCGQPRSASRCSPPELHTPRSPWCGRWYALRISLLFLFWLKYFPWPFFVSGTWFSTSQPEYGAWPFRSWSTSLNVPKPLPHLGVAPLCPLSLLQVLALVM